MHAAPPVRYPLKPSRLRRVCEGGVFVLSLIGSLLWAFQTAPSLSRGLTVGCLCGLVGVMLLLSIRHDEVGEVVWDGRSWAVYSDPPGQAPLMEAGELMVLLDLQFFLLLRTGSKGVWREKCLWLERRSSPSRWHLLRCAVYSRAAHEPSKAPIGS